MQKFLKSLALAAFAASFIAGGTQAEAKPCVKAPKHYLPCTVKPPNPRPSKARSN